ncbi:MAG: PEGA domain-containing protein [Nitrospira sp.]|nr:PEGA domain-containing protein [Nitrospira sp.]
MTNQLVRAAFASAFVVCLSGCATIFTGSNDNITFKSVPEGARVEINGNSIGRTPVTVPVKRALTPPQVMLKLDGYDQRSILLQNGFNGVSILNIFFWPGFIVDAATGTLMKYDVVTYEAELDPKTPPQQAK